MYIYIYQYLVQLVCNILWSEKMVQTIQARATIAPNTTVVSQTNQVVAEKLQYGVVQRAATPCTTIVHLKK